jgi:hypothetical protein
MTNLRGQTPGEVNAYNNSLNQAAIGGSGAANTTLATRAGFNKGGSFWDSAGKILGGLGSVASAFAPDKDPDDKKDAKGQRVTGSEEDTRNPTDDVSRFGGSDSYTDAFKFDDNDTSEGRFNVISTDINPNENYGYRGPYGDYNRRYWNS